MLSSIWMNVQRRSVHLNVIGRLPRVTDCWSPTEPSPYIMQSDNSHRQSRVHDSRSRGKYLLSLHPAPHKPCMELPELRVLMRLPSRCCLCEIYRAMKIATTLSREL